MDHLAPAPGTAVPGAPPPLQRPLTREDGIQTIGPAARLAGQPPTHTPNHLDTGPATSTPNPATQGRHERAQGVDGIRSLSSYLPAIGLLCAAVTVWLGTRRRVTATSY